MDKIDAKNLQQQIKTLQQLTQTQITQIRILVQENKEDQLRKLLTNIIQQQKDPLYQSLIDLFQSQDVLKFASFSVIEITKIPDTQGQLKWVFRTTMGNDYIDIQELQSVQHVGKYFLMDNFKCPYVYDRQETIILDCSYLRTCFVDDLSRLTRNGKVNQYVQMKNLSELILLQGTATQNDNIQIYLRNQGDGFNISYIKVTIGNIVFNNMEILGNTRTKIKLTINQLRKTQAKSWQIKSDFIYVKTLTYQSTVFEESQENNIHIQRIYVKDDDKKIYFEEIGNRQIVFQQILCMDSRIIGNLQKIQAMDYISGWN